VSFVLDEQNPKPANPGPLWLGAICFSLFVVVVLLVPTIASTSISMFHEAPYAASGPGASVYTAWQSSSTSGAVNQVYRQAPYTAGSLFKGKSNGGSDCPFNGAITSAPALNLTTGYAQYAIAASIVPCAGGGYDQSGWQYVAVGVHTATFTVPANGSFLLSARMQAIGAFFYNISDNVTAKQGSWVDFALDPYVCIVNASSQVTLGCSETLYNYTTPLTWSTAAQGVGVHRFDWSANASSPAGYFPSLRLTHGQHYYFEAYMRSWVTVYAAASSGGHAWGEIDFDSPSYHVWIASTIVYV
jgi:hypothetical protein